MTRPLGFSCTCGAIRGSIDNATPRGGTHLVCHCADCRAAELVLGQPDPAPEGVAIYQTTPDMIVLDRGADRLGLMRLSPKGLLRWHAACCDAPLFNTLARPGLPFVGVHVARLDDPARIGPVVVHSFLPQRDGGARHKGAGIMVWRMLSRMASARLSGRWRQTPFFDPATGAPVAQARILTKAERAAFAPSRG